jgi:beta-glucosidase
MRYARAVPLALTLLVLSLPLCVARAAGTAAAQRPWLDSRLSPDRRADLALRAMTRGEKLSLVFGYFGSVMPNKGYTPPPGARPGSAGFVPGIARMGLPPQWLTDAGLGVATQRASLYAYRSAPHYPPGSPRPRPGMWPWRKEATP